MDSNERPIDIVVALIRPRLSVHHTTLSARAFLCKNALKLEKNVKSRNFLSPNSGLLTLLTPSDKQKACCLYRKNELILFN